MIINYGKARHLDKAEDMVGKMTDTRYAPSFITYESLTIMYGLCDRVSKSRKIFNKLVESGRDIKVSTLNATLDVYCMNGLLMEAHKLFVNANNIGVVSSSSTYKILYKAYAKANIKELQGNLSKHMEKGGIVPNKRFFLEALGAFWSSKETSVSTSAAAASSRPEDSVKTQRWILTWFAFFISFFY